MTISIETRIYALKDSTATYIYIYIYIYTYIYISLQSWLGEARPKKGEEVTGACAKSRRGADRVNSHRWGEKGPVQNSDKNRSISDIGRNLDGGR